MIEYDNVKESLAALIEIADATSLRREDGTPATAADVQDLIRERAYELADLLGVSELYLDKE